MVLMGLPVTGSHTPIVPLLLALASSLLSGLNATPATLPLEPVSAWMVLMGWPVTGSHSRTVRSPSALASSLPSALNATPATRDAVAVARRIGAVAQLQHPMACCMLVLHRQDELMGTSAFASAARSLSRTLGSSSGSPRRVRHSTRPCSAQTLSGCC